MVSYLYEVERNAPTRQATYRKRKHHDTEQHKGFSITFNDEDGMPVGVRFASPIPDEAALKLRERIISETVEIEIVANGTLDTETYREVVYDGAFFIFKDKDGGIITTGGIVHDPHIVKPLIIGAGVMHGRITRFWVQPAGVNEINVMIHEIAA